MGVEFFGFDHGYRAGDSAMHLIAPRSPRHAALLRLAGRSPQRCRALPYAPITAHSGASNCGFQVETAAIVPTGDTT